MGYLVPPVPDRFNPNPTLAQLQLGHDAPFDERP